MSDYQRHVRELKKCKTHGELYEYMMKIYSDKYLCYSDVWRLDEYAAQMGVHLLLS